MSNMQFLANVRRRPANALTSPDAIQVPISYTNSNLQFIGRWIDTGTGKYCGWTGGYLCFKISGTSFFNLTVDIVDSSTSAHTNLIVFIDNDPKGTLYSLTDATETFNGSKLLQIAVPNDGRSHIVEVYTNGIGADFFALNTKITFKGMSIGSNGVLLPWTQGSTRLLCLGDSWMSGNSWTRLLPRSSYEIFQVANGGYTCAQMNTNYFFNYSGNTNSSDPTPGKVIISYGVNDYNAGITVGNFQTSLLALIDKVQTRYTSSVPIYLVRVPNNGVLLYGQYGTAMSNAAGLRTNTFYVNTTSIDSIVTFDSDTFHLDGGGKKVMSDFVATQI